MAERLTEYNKTGWALKLNDPQNEFEARQQLMRKFKLVCEKLGKLEDIMEKYDIEDLEQLDIMLFCLSSETKFQLKQLQKLYKKYDIKNVEELEQELKIAHKIERLKDKNIDLNNAIIVFNKNFIKDYIREIEELKVVSDTWQKACELACKHIVDACGDCPVEVSGWEQDDNWCDNHCSENEKLMCWDRFFYEQAKKEGEYGDKTSAC